MVAQKHRFHERSEQQENLAMAMAMEMAMEGGEAE
jgi:hypothetical protein